MLLCLLAIETHNQSINQSINQSTNQPINQSTNQPINQSTNQPTNQPTNQSTNQPINQSTNQPINQSTNQPTNQPINQSTNQPTNQPTNHFIYLSICLSYLFVCTVTASWLMWCCTITNYDLSKPKGHWGTQTLHALVDLQGSCS